MEEIPINPHETIGDKQWMFWNQWLDKEPVEFLLIDFFKAPVVRRKGLYIIYYAIAEAPIKHLGIDKGDELLLSITYRAYCNALNMLRNEYRIPSQKKFAEGKNLYIKLERVNNTTIKIHKQEVRAPTEEQLLEADRQYKIIIAEQEQRKKLRNSYKWGMDH